MGDITGISLTRVGDRAVVRIEVGGVWIDLISEPLDSPFSHIVNESGIAKAVSENRSN